MRNIRCSVVAVLCMAVSLLVTSAVNSAPQTGGGDDTGVVVSEKPNVSKPWVSLKSYSECPVLIYTRAILGPSSTSAQYQSWSRTTLSNIYNLGRLPGNLPGELGHKLLPQYLSQSGDVTNWTVWMTVQIITKDPSFKFTASQIKAIWKSSDAANSLGKTNSFENPKYIYSPYGSYGINWNAAGPRNGDEVDTSSYWNSKPVNELIFLGSMGKYYLTDSAGVSNYVSQFPDFQDSCTWQLVGTESSVLGYASKTLHYRELPISWNISISKADPGIQLGISSSTTDTWVLLQTENIGSPNWNPVATVNAGDIIYRPANIKSGFWKLILQ